RQSRTQPRTTDTGAEASSSVGNWSSLAPELEARPGQTTVPRCAGPAAVVTSCADGFRLPLAYAIPLAGAGVRVLSVSRSSTMAVTAVEQAAAGSVAA